MHSTQCYDCVWIINGRTCVAFEEDPPGVPEEIVTGQFDHSRPYKGDRGVQFKSRKGLTMTEIVKMQIARLEQLNKPK